MATIAASYAPNRALAAQAAALAGFHRSLMGEISRIGGGRVRFLSDP